MNCINCHRAMILLGALYYCRFCGVQAADNKNECALFSVAWLDQAPCFKPIGPIGANVQFADDVPVMSFQTTDCDFHLQL